MFGYNVCLPSLVVAATSAPAIHYQLHKHPWMSPIWAELRQLHNLSKLNMMLRETDAHYANEKLGAHLLQEDDLGWQAHWYCSLHQIQLTEAALTGVTSLGGINLISKLYSLTLFLHAGGSFAHMVSTIGDELRLAPLQMKRSAVPAACREFTEELRDFMLTHYKRFQRAGSMKPSHHWLADLDDDDGEDDAAEVTRSERDFGLKLDAYFAVFNGELWKPYEYVHYCNGCCSSQAEALQRAEAACLSVPFREIPVTPAANKWTKLGPCLDLMMVGLLTHRILAGCFSRLQKSSSEDRGDEAHDNDQIYLHDIDWSALQGRYSMVQRNQET